MKDISKLQEGQKIKLIFTDDYTIEGTVRFIEEDEEYDYEWTVYLGLEDQEEGFFAHQSEIKDIVVLDQKV
ncbi:MAG: hypothetical protein MSC52_04535 [Solobacterium sp.]|nr:hypothetical protein [Solobacterium sp.]MDY2952995.1 hypothetical protein [Erysipelotrichaceae bacterium]MCI6846153.1 hypothetical protein [Solobacterium sp.]MCI7156835.1 hypothetical protein [Solobacterium sp.]MDD7775509.1 hypothetical protein [Solobacterium sp.]